MKFSKWLKNRINEGKKSRPVIMPKEKSNIIKVKEPKQRIPMGRKDTSFDSKKQGRKSGTRGSVTRKSIGEY